MTNALIQTIAATTATGRRVSGLARHGLAIGLLAVAGIAAAQAAYSGRPDDPQNQARVAPPRGERGAAPQVDPARDHRQYESAPRDGRGYEEVRRPAPQVQQDGVQREAGRRGRLTPDERRDLRRQINEAGMDIYPNAQRR